MITRFKVFENNFDLKGDEPDWLINQLEDIQIDYLNYVNEIKIGTIVCNRAISRNLYEIFEELLDMKFPIYSVIPISNFGWDDDKSCVSNNTSCFNYRIVKGTDRLSDHGKGMAIDINPMQNPWITPKFGNLPKGSDYNLEEKGTITKEVVDIFSSRDFLWGGNWENPDYQHFYKIR